MDRLDRRWRAPNESLAWLVFHVANVTKPDNSQVPLDVFLVSVNKEVEVEPKSRKNSVSAMSGIDFPHGTRPELGPLVTLIASTQANANSGVDTTAPRESLEIPSETEAKLILLRDISASKNHVSDSFQARLVEPVFLESRILLPEGTLFEVTVLKSQAPRTLSRSGSILLSFTNMTIPGGKRSPIAASVAGAQVSQRSHTVIDPEGRMHGDRPGKAWMLLIIGATAGITKEVDGITQLIIEALVSTATDASTAGTASVVSTCASAIFLLTPPRSRCGSAEVHPNEKRPGASGSRSRPGRCGAARSVTSHCV